MLLFSICRQDRKEKQLHNAIVQNVFQKSFL